MEYPLHLRLCCKRVEDRFHPVGLVVWATDNDNVRGRPVEQTTSASLKRGVSRPYDCVDPVPPDKLWTFMGSFGKKLARSSYNGLNFICNLVGGTN